MHPFDSACLQAFSMAMGTPIMVFMMIVLFFLPAMGIRDVRRFGYGGAYNLIGFLCLWVMLETICSLAFTALILPEDQWPAARDLIAQGTIALLTLLFIALGLTWTGGALSRTLDNALCDAISHSD
jgi:hypothetical protein